MALKDKSLKVVKLKRYGYTVFILLDKDQNIEIGTYGRDYTPLEELVEILAQVSDVEFDYHSNSS